MKTDVMVWIDHDFPHQVLLPIKLGADVEEDLIWWLDRRIGRRDMYVDLNQHFIRYCFYERRTRTHSGCGLSPAASRQRAEGG